MQYGIRNCKGDIMDMLLIFILLIVVSIMFYS